MIKTLIVDDERLARTELKRLLNLHSKIDIVAEAENAKQAQHFLTTMDIDLVFLDIQMPNCTGLELATHIKPSTQFVFCTAFDSYALDAFELNALDYLVKPIDPERLVKTLQRLEIKTSMQTTSINFLPDNHGLLLKFDQNSRIVRLNEINRFESVGNQSALYTAYGKTFLNSSLSKIEERLDPQQFFKASRTDIIRVDAIKRLETGISAGSMLAILNDDLEIEISRRQAQILRNIFGGI